MRAHPSVVCEDPAWIRRYLACGLLPLFLLLGLPLLLFLSPRVGLLRAALAASFLGAPGAWLALTHALWGHRRAHLAEALRLGYAARPRGSMSPLALLRAGMPLALEGGREDEEGRRLDLLLIRGIAPLLDACAERYGDRHMARALLTAALACDAMLAVPSGYPPALPLFLFCGAAAASASGALCAARAALPRFSRDEGKVFDGSVRGFWVWPFLDLWIQRRRRDRAKLRRDFRLLLRVGAGVRGGRRVLELGSGGGVLWEHCPARWREAWVRLDMDRLALHWAASRGAGHGQVCANAAALPFPDGSFDAVVGLTFFDAVFPSQREAAVAEAFRVLKPGGRLLHLQDFPDWPGPALAERANVLLERAGSRGRLRFARRMRLLFPRLSAEEQGSLPAALAALEAELPAPLADEAEWLRGIFERSPLRGRREEDPRAAFSGILRRALRRAGFEVLEESKGLSARLSDCVFLSARKPARPESSQALS